MDNERTLEIAAEEVVVTSKKKDKLWNSGYLKMLSIALLIAVSVNMLGTALPLYVQELGADKSIAGMVMGTFTIAALICRPIYGNLADTKGRKIVLMIGISILIISIFGLTVTTSVMMILALRGVMGVGFSGFSTAGGTIAADVLPESKISEGIGYYGISFNIATAFGPQLALIIIAMMGYNSVFYLGIITCVLGLVLASTFNYEKKAKLAAIQEGQEIIERPKTKFSIKNAFEKTAYPGSITQFFLAMPMGFAMTFIPTFGITMGIEGVGAYFTVFALTLLATRLFIGKIADRYGSSKVIFPGIILVLGGLVVLFFTTTLMQVLVAGGLIGFGYGCINPTMNAFILKVSPVDRRGSANATYYAAFDGGSGSGSVFGGMIVQAMGFQNTFIFLIGIMLVGMGCYFKFLRKQMHECEITKNAAC